MAPLRGNKHIVLATGRYLATATMPSNKSNALIGGHRFRAAMSPQFSSPIIRNVVSYKENDEKSNIGLELDSGTLNVEEKTLSIEMMREEAAEIGDMWFHAYWE
jgi:hypothetical protein